MRLVVFLIAGTLSGCASSPFWHNQRVKWLGDGEHHEISHHDPTTAEQLTARLGTMSYEESLQMFGPPTACAEAGQTRSCRWVFDQGGTILTGFGNVAVAQPIGGHSAQLAFVSDKLKTWQLQGNWK
jgi:hypothetical protein